MIFQLAAQRELKVLIRNTLAKLDSIVTGLSWEMDKRFTHQCRVQEWKTKWVVRTISRKRDYMDKLT